MLCQLCSATNPDDADYCQRCGHKLLVVSGGYTEDDQDAFDESAEEVMSFDEHLLERVSLLEEVLRRTARSAGQMLGTAVLMPAVVGWSIGREYAASGGGESTGGRPGAMASVDGPT